MGARMRKRWNRDMVVGAGRTIGIRVGGQEILNQLRAEAVSPAGKVRPIEDLRPEELEAIARRYGARVRR